MSVWVWLIVAALLVLLEAVTFDFILGWFAIGSIFACIMAIIGTPVWAQAFICVMTGLIFMALFRKYLLNLALNLKNAKIKKYALGKTGRVVKVITRDMLFLARFEKKTFLVMLRDPAVLSVGADVRVVDAVEGVAIAIPDGLQNPQDEHTFTPQPLFVDIKNAEADSNTVSIDATSNIDKSQTFGANESDETRNFIASVQTNEAGLDGSAKAVNTKASAAKTATATTKKRGRPAGSKNKAAKIGATKAVSTKASTSKAVNGAAKKRGRPAGSKNKSKSQGLMAVAAEVVENVVKKRGRPKDSKNRPKV